MDSSHFLNGAFPLSYTALLALVVVLAYLWYRLTYAPYSVFTKLGIPGPRPRAFFGNSFDFISQDIKIFARLTRQYGKVCGFYRGAVPMYLIADPDMLKQIMVKEFSYFIDRAPAYEVNGLGYGIRGGKSGLLFRLGEEWQQTRRIVSPTFTSGKLKMMVQLIEESCTALNERVQKIADSRKSDNIWRLYGQFTMETILATAFGFKVELLRGKVQGGDKLIQAAQNIFNQNSGGGLLAMTLTSLHSHFHWLTPVMRWLGTCLPVRSNFMTLRKAAKEFVQARRTNQLSKKKDMIQLLIDARVEDQSTDPESIDVFSSSTTTSSQTKKTLTDDDIIATIMAFMLAGYETTSNTLGYTAYLLALNPDKQDKLCSEIDAYYEKNEESSLYEGSTSIEYLDWVIQESLRIYPPGALTARHCQKTCTIGGVTILEGSLVVIPIYSLHHSPEYWENPEEFEPERFHPDLKAKRHPLVHMPFGWGPRNCIGSRFALMEAKMALLSTLKHYKFQRSLDTEVPLKTRRGITLGPANGIFLKVVERNH